VLRSDCRWWVARPKASFVVGLKGPGVPPVGDFGGGTVMSVYEFECKACDKHVGVSVPDQ